MDEDLKTILMYVLMLLVTLAIGIGSYWVIFKIAKAVFFE